MDWDFIPEHWPQVTSQQEHDALQRVLVGFEQATALIVEGDLAERLRISADGLKFRLREWEQSNLPPAGHEDSTE